MALLFALVSGPIRADGNGMNPLLQYPEIVIHPPLLCLGLVGFSVPFALALSALMLCFSTETWIPITRRWTIVTWLFLTAGLFSGCTGPMRYWVGEAIGLGSCGKCLADALANGHSVPSLHDHAGTTRLGAFAYALQQGPDLLELLQSDVARVRFSMRHLS